MRKIISILHDTGTASLHSSVSSKARVVLQRDYYQTQVDQCSLLGCVELGTYLIPKWIFLQVFVSSSRCRDYFVGTRLCTFLTRNAEMGTQWELSNLTLFVFKHQGRKVKAQNIIVTIFQTNTQFLWESFTRIWSASPKVAISPLSLGDRLND